MYVLHGVLCSGTPPLGGRHPWIPLGWHVSGVGSLDTLHATDGLVDTIPGIYTLRMACRVHTTICIPTTSGMSVSGDVSSVGSLDTLHATDDMTIPTMYLYLRYSCRCCMRTGCI